MSSITNQIVANIKKTSTNFNTFSFTNSENVVCIDTSFNRIGINRKNPVYSIDISRTDRNLIEIWITASSFCHQMVRSVTGTLVEIGLGRIASDEMSLILQERNRNSAGRVAPPNGLTLMEVEY